MPIDTERLRLHKSARGNIVTSKWGLLFSLPFVGAGGWIAAIGLGLVPVSPSKVHAPLWVLTAIGGLFMLAGTYFAAMTLRGMLRLTLGARRNRLAVWRYDYPWSRRAIVDETGKTIVKNFTGLLFFSAFLAAMHGGVLLNDGFDRNAGDNWIVYVVFGLFDLALLGGVGYLLYLVARRLRFGKTQLRLSSFPFYLGSTLSVTFEGGNRLANLPQIDAVLRCVEEVAETRRTTKGTRTQVVCYQVYRDRQSVSSDGQGRAVMSFPLPDTAPGTQLITNPPTYWELVVSVALPGVDYEGTFLLPVYTNAPSA